MSTYKCTHIHIHMHTYLHRFSSSDEAQVGRKRLLVFPLHTGLFHMLILMFQSGPCSAKGLNDSLDRRRSADTTTTSELRSCPHFSSPPEIKFCFYWMTFSALPLLRVKHFPSQYLIPHHPEGSAPWAQRLSWKWNANDMLMICKNTKQGVNDHLWN